VQRRFNLLLTYLLYELDHHCHGCNIPVSWSVECKVHQILVTDGFTGAKCLRVMWYRLVVALIQKVLFRSAQRRVQEVRSPAPERVHGVIESQFSHVQSTGGPFQHVQLARGRSQRRRRSLFTRRTLDFAIILPSFLLGRQVQQQQT